MSSAIVSTSFVAGLSRRINALSHTNNPIFRSQRVFPPNSFRNLALIGPFTDNLLFYLVPVVDN